MVKTKLPVLLIDLDISLNLMTEQFIRTPVEAEHIAACTLAAIFEKVGLEPDADQKVAEYFVGCCYRFARFVEVCIRTNPHSRIGVDVLEEPFEMNGCRQVIIHPGDAADENVPTDLRI